MLVKELFDLCYSKWEAKVDIVSNIKGSSSQYRGYMSDVPYYLLNKKIEVWWIDSYRYLEITIDEKE